MRILVEAYACRPNASSEGGLGWAYPTRYARLGHDVTLVTEASAREMVTAELASEPDLDLDCFFVDRRGWPLRLGWTVGSALQYVLWLLDASSLAKRLDAQARFDLLHHASYGSLLGGTFLWRLQRQVVFGPVGGGQVAPPAFLSEFGRWRRSERLRTLVVRRLWPLVWHARMACRRSTVLATNEETARLAQKMGATSVVRFKDVGISEDFAPAEFPERDHRSPVRVLWVGRFLERKGLNLAVQAMARVPATSSATLQILGAGYNVANQADVGRYLSEASASGLRLEVLEPVPYEEIGRIYAGADILLFTSLRDSGGSAVLEAMAYGLPVVCLDHQGAGELVGDAGIRVPVSTPGATASALAVAITALCADPARRTALGRTGWQRARDFTWTQKALDLLAATDREPAR